MIRKPEFTQWWFHQLSEGIRSRHRALALAENRTPHHELVYITWTNCIGRNKCKAEKLYHHDRMKDLKINDAWDHCISWQKKKLNRLYDTLEAWRKREHLILKRMNTHNFSSNLAPHSIWNFKVYKQVAKAKKLVRKQFSRPAAPPSFEHVIRQARKRLAAYYYRDIPDTDGLWELSIKANKLKIHTMHLRLDWTQTIFQNLEKMRYRYYEHDRKNTDGYSWGMFR